MVKTENKEAAKGQQNKTKASPNFSVGPTEKRQRSSLSRPLIEGIQPCQRTWPISIRTVRDRKVFGPTHPL